VALTVNAFSPPTITAPSAETVATNGTLTFSAANSDAITVADSGPGASSDSLSLSVSHGQLTLSTTSGLTFTTGTNGSASFTVTGSVANLNAALSGLTYAPTSGYTGSDTLAATIRDTTDSLSASTSVALTVSGAVAPSITAPPTAATYVNTALVFTSPGTRAISVTDGSAGTNVEQLVLQVTHGTLTLASTSGITIVSGTNNSAAMTIDGTLANLNAALNGLTFMPTTNYAGLASLVLAYTDLGNGLMGTSTTTITIGKQPTKFGTGSPTAPPTAAAAAVQSVPSSTLSSPTLSSAVTSPTSPSSGDATSDLENSTPVDAQTQWLGLAAAVDLLVG
jgi:large repetitive protein